VRASDDDGEDAEPGPTRVEPAARGRAHVTEAATATAAMGEGEDAALPRDRLPVDDWDRYQFAGVLGAGGMGVVYRAYDPRLKRHVALKFLSRDKPGLIKKFVDEARAQARVEHAHVCKVFEVGDAHGRPYIAMQWIDGKSLRDAAPEMTLEDKVHVVRKVAEAVHDAHGHGLIHRDLKPSNIMVERTEQGRWWPYVLDFGIARDVDAAADGHIAGTPAFMAPEQAAGRAVDRRTDVYGLGATLFALVTGRPPAESATSMLRETTLTTVDGTRKQTQRIPDDLATILLKCLERQPERRYLSAAAVAEDLRRFLEHEPIAARPHSVLYRARKRLRKSRTLAAVIAIAVVAVGVLSVLAISTMRARREAERRVAIAQKFGEEVGRLEALTRRAFTAPRHDIRREREQILARAAAITEEAKKLGGSAPAQAAHAVGRVHLALRDEAAARTELENAWRGGARTPEVGYALGLALARLYRRGLEETARIPDEHDRDRARAELRRTLRDPALEHLAAARGLELESPAYVEGVIAFVEGDHALAITKANEAAAQTPSMYEAHELVGDALRARAVDAKWRGAYEDAAKDLAAADEAFLRAAAFAPSDPAVLRGLCRERDAANDLADETLTLELADVDRAIEPCVWAAEVDPGATDPLVRQAEILTGSAEFLWNRRGVDPRPLIERALAAADAARAIDEGLARAELARARAVWLRGRHAWERGESPEASFIEANRAFERAIALDPRLVVAYGEQCFFLKERADWEWERGVDPLPTLREAIAIAERGAKVDPEATGPVFNLATVWQRIGDWEAERGGDPVPALSHSIEAFERLMKLNPRNASAANNLGLAFDTRAYYRLEHGDAAGEEDFDRAAAAYQTVLALRGDAIALNNLGFLATTRARHLARLGQDPRPAVAEGVTFLERSLAANPDEPMAYFNTADLKLTEAEWLLERGDDPREALARVRLATTASNQRRSGKPDVDVLAYEAESWTLEARYAMAQQASPASALAKAEEVLARAEKGTPTVYTLASRVRLQRAKAEHLASRGDLAEARAALARGVRAVEALAALDRGSPETRRMTGELALIDARTSPTPAARRAAASRAVTELESAIAANRFLERRIAPLLADARRLSL
jgi:serine/threonine-protein kinase